ncbi:MAG: hypothetical protein SGI74_03230 [Oligoflexia bacterium]|nr:hypothetical protein [Oligoflexia bacterium]
MLSYKVWKQKKITDSQALLTELKKEIRKYNNPKNPEEEEYLSSLNLRLSHAELNWGVIQELSANDYFLLYLAPQAKNNYEALKSAAKTLSPSDMADILEAYQRKLQAPELVGAQGGSSQFESPAL